MLGLSLRVVIISAAATGAPTYPASTPTNRQVLLCEANYPIPSYRLSDRKAGGMRPAVQQLLPRVGQLRMAVTQGG